TFSRSTGSHLMRERYVGRFMRGLPSPRSMKVDGQLLSGESPLYPERTVAQGIFVGYYRISWKPGAVTTRAASAASAATSQMCAQWSLCDAILQRLAQDFEDMALALRPLTQ